MGGKGMTKAMLGGMGEEVTLVESQSSGLSGGLRVPRKLRAAPLCQAASVRASQGDLIAEKLLRNLLSGRSRDLCGARGAGGVPAPGSWALGHRPDAAQGWAERGTLRRPGMPSPWSQSTHAHCHDSTHRERGRNTLAHTCACTHTGKCTHSRDMHVDVRTHVDVDMHVDVRTLTGMYAWMCTHTQGHARGRAHTHGDVCEAHTHTWAGEPAGLVHARPLLIHVGSRCWSRAGHRAFPLRMPRPASALSRGREPPPPPGDPRRSQKLLISPASPLAFPRSHVVRFLQERLPVFSLGC